MAAVVAVKGKPPPSPVLKTGGTKIDAEKLFQTLLEQMQTAFKAPPSELMYQGTQEVVLDGKKFTLSREVHDRGDYTYTLTSLDNNTVISCSFYQDKEEEYISADFTFQDKLKRINTSNTFNQRWRSRFHRWDPEEDGLVATAWKLFRTRYTVPPLMQNGRGVKFDDKTLDLLSRVKTDQDDQLAGLANQLQVALRTYRDAEYKKWEGIMPVRIDGKKFTLRLVRERGHSFAFILTSDDGKIKIFQGSRENREEYFAFSFDENTYPRGFKGDYPTNEVRTFDEKIVEHVRWKAFKQAMWPYFECREDYYSTNEYEWIDRIQDIAEDEGNRYSMGEAIAMEFGVFTSKFIDREHVKVSPLYREAKIMAKAFEKTLVDILTNDRGALHIGTTMGLTARYCLNGNLPVAQIPDFWRAALTYTNEILDDKAFSEQIMEGTIEELIPLSEKDPLSALQRLCDIKPITTEGINFKETSLISKVPPNPFYKLMIANSAGEILEVINSDSSLQRMLHKSTSSLSDRSEPLSKILAQIPENVSSLGLNYLRAYMGNEKAFIDVAFRLLPFEHGLTLFAPILRKIEVFMDREVTLGESSRAKKGMRLHHHPNLPELFLILNNQQVQKGHDLVNLATRCITSIERFMDYDLEVIHQLVEQWAKIGLLTHAHKLWKYDTQGGGDSLFSKFGFVLFPRENKDTKLGASYVITKKQNDSLKINEGTIFEFRRGYILVTNPQWGTLIIRNSSLVFGRDLLNEPAYYLDEPLSIKTIKTIDSEDDISKLGFKRILAPDLYKEGDFVSNLEHLVNEILAVKEGYAKWRFDPENFIDDKNFKGDLTPGMQVLVNRMENKLGEIDLGISDKPLPVLGIFSSRYPPENPFEFYGNDLSMHNHLELTEEVLTEIKDRLNGKWNEQKYPNSLWIKFIQAAVNRKGEIVLIDPPKKEKA